MSGFPSVPRIIGDTDDETSIHLNQYVGKASPLRSRTPRKSQSRQHISHIQQQQQQPSKDQMQKLTSSIRSNRENNIDNKIITTIHSNKDIDLDEEDVNISYEKYLHGQPIEEYEELEEDYHEEDDEDYIESDNTYLDSDEDIEEPELNLDEFNQKSVFNRDNSKFKDPSPPRSPIFDQIQQEQNELPRQTRSKPKQPKLNPRSRILVASGTVLISFLITVLAYYIYNFNPISIPDLNLQKINTKFQYFDEKFNQLEIETKQSNKLLNQGINKLSEQLNQIQENIENTPISYKNNQIQITPELHQFLFKFIENYSTNQTPEQLTQYIDEKLKSISVKEIESMIQDIKKFQSGQYETIISEIMSKLPPTSNQAPTSEELKLYIDTQIVRALDQLNQEIHLRLSNILDNLTIVNNTIQPTHPTNEIWLNSMLDLFSRGSVKVNYADYSLGTRILGFLTTIAQNKSYSIWYKMMYGWWIYNENKHDPHNANHVLSDDGTTWICEQDCQLGIRLHSSIIPTDLLLEIEGTDDKIVEIGFKPNTRSGYDKLSQFENMPSSPYLKKFKLIKSVKLNSGLIHVKFPIRFINLQVAGRDFYLNFISSKTVRVKRVKIYGIKEVDVAKYSDQFKLMVDRFSQAEDIESSVEDSKRQPYDRVDHYDLDKDIYL